MVISLPEYPGGRDGDIPPRGMAAGPGGRLAATLCAFWWLPPRDWRTRNLG